MITKILGGYEITTNEVTNEIVSLKREGREVKFAYMFYVKHQSELDIYTNIGDYVKSAQERNEQDRVSVNLNNEQTNTTDSDKLSRASLILLEKISGEVSYDTIKDIIDTAKILLVNSDKELKEICANFEKVSSTRMEVEQIFGADSEMVKQLVDKLGELLDKKNERIKFLNQSV